MTQTFVAGLITAAYPLMTAGTALFLAGRILAGIREQADDKDWDERAWHIIMGLDLAGVGGLAVVLAKYLPTILQYWFNSLPR